MNWTSEENFLGGAPHLVNGYGLEQPLIHSVQALAETLCYLMEQAKLQRNF